MPLAVLRKTIEHFSPQAPHSGSAGLVNSLAGHLSNVFEFPGRAIRSAATEAAAKVIKPTDEQWRAIKDIIAWFDDPTRQVYRLAGPVGAGKSTIVSWVLRELRARKGGAKLRAVTCAQGSIAADILCAKGAENPMTHHRALYALLESEAGVTFTLALNGPAASADLVIIDEGCMVGTTQGSHFRHLAKKILVCYDPHQLLPISERAYFLAGPPDFYLTEIHPQAQGNPIIQISQILIDKRKPAPGEYRGENGEVARVLPLTKDTQHLVYRDGPQVIVGVHRVRWVYTQRIRKLRGISDRLPVKGERVICRRNDIKTRLFNGMMGTLTANPFLHPEYPGLLVMNVQIDGEDRARENLLVDPALFMQHFDHSLGKPTPPRGIHLFDWGHCIACHSAQGSEWPDVTVVDDSQNFGDDWWRWLYTADTRSRRDITILLRD